jgi:hypothetical protein
MQLSQIDESQLVSISIRTNLLALDEYTEHAAEQARDNDDINLEAEDGVDKLAHTSVGSKADNVSICYLQLSSDPAFGLLQKQVNERLSLIHNTEIQLPDIHEVSVNESHIIVLLTNVLGCSLPLCSSQL